MGDLCASCCIVLGFMVVCAMYVALAITLLWSFMVLVLYVCHSPSLLFCGYFVVRHIVYHDGHYMGLMVLHGHFGL